jgi:hypothetical protein
MQPRPLVRAALAALVAYLGSSCIVAGHASANVTVGFVEDWPGTDEAGWDSGAGHTNPGTGGTLGVGDGFERVERTFAAQLGVRSTSTHYAGDWLRAGASKIRLALNDVETNEALSLHVAIGNSVNFWQYNVGFAPPENAWGTFEVDLTDSSQFTRIIGTDSYAGALQNTDRLLVRHDLAPYGQSPNGLAGQFGLDHLQILGPGFVGVGDGPLAGGTQPVWLAPPSPNPSRGAVACAVETNDAGMLRFSVLDARGRVVRRASLEATSAGRRLWMWDGLDESGARVAAGVYVVRVVGPGGGTSRNIVRVD